MSTFAKPVAVTALQRALLGGAAAASGFSAAVMIVAAMLWVGVGVVGDEWDPVLISMMIVFACGAGWAAVVATRWRRAVVVTDLRCPPSPPGQTTVMSVRTWPGIVGTAGFMLGVAVVIGTFPRLLWLLTDGADSTRLVWWIASILSYAAFCWFALASSSVLIWSLTTLGRERFRLTDGGIVVPPDAVSGVDFIAWEELGGVVRTEYDYGRFALVGHDWVFRTKSRLFIRVLHPSGALPWPSRVAREIRRRAPHARVI